MHTLCVLPVVLFSFVNAAFANGAFAHAAPANTAFASATFANAAPANAAFARPVLAAPATALAARALPFPQGARQVELFPITETNYDHARPAGKETDAILGDFVLRNAHVVAVIAQPTGWRNANMTTRGVGGGIIDLTRRDVQSDQLSAFYPGGRAYDFHDVSTVRVRSDPTARDGTTRRRSRLVTLSMRSAPSRRGIRQTVRYTLHEDWHYVLVDSTFENVGTKPAILFLEDHVRADRTFKHGVDEKTGLHWVADEWFRQAYGFWPIDHGVATSKTGARPFVLRYLHDEQLRIELAPGGKHRLQRRLVPDATVIQLRGRVGALNGDASRRIELRVGDAAGPIDRARLTLFRGKTVIGAGRTGPGAVFAFAAPIEALRLRVEAIGRTTTEVELGAKEDLALAIPMPLPGIVVGAVTDAFGRAIPCKVAFRGVDGTRSPDFGPDSGAFGIKNLMYTADGRFRAELQPGNYDVVISHGPEFDIVRRRISVQRGRVVTLHAQLHRTVDTRGWVSTDFHSHSSPSGDNTSSQLGRVLNLLAEHIEFAPCTEHNRVSTYVPHLEALGAARQMATCSGMELTGKPGDVNHQNAFPLHRHRGHQDNGAPRTDEDPIVQIERLALWDGGSDKLVQTNHPRLEKILGDRNLDGEFDGGYAKMLGFMDVVEIHPPHHIFSKVQADAKGRTFNNRMFRWLQMLNLGHRVPGVVNTDAHYNRHGSGWLRNWVRCATDDPAQIDTIDIVHSCEHGHIVMSNGPFLEVSWQGGKQRAAPGDAVPAPGGKGRLHVRVQCANWLDINRVQVFCNGRPEASMNFTRKSHPKMFAANVVKFDQQLATAFTRDTHVIVAAVGEGLTLGPVYDMPHGRDRPIAVSNPIFLDVDGNGFQPNGDLLGVPLPHAAK